MVVFTIKDDAVTPLKGHFQQAVKKLPVAHREAQQLGATHLHQKVSEAATKAGLSAAPITLSWDRGHAYVGIAHSEAGDKVADAEFGTPESAPNPVLRTAHTA